MRGIAIVTLEGTADDYLPVVLQGHRANAVAIQTRAGIKRTIETTVAIDAYDAIAGYIIVRR